MRYHIQGNDCGAWYTFCSYDNVAAALDAALFWGGGRNGNEYRFVVSYPYHFTVK